MAELAPSHHRSVSTNLYSLRQNSNRILSITLKEIDDKVCNIKNGLKEAYKTALSIQHWIDDEDPSFISNVKVEDNENFENNSKKPNQIKVRMAYKTLVSLNVEVHDSIEEIKHLIKFKSELLTIAQSFLNNSLDEAISSLKVKLEAAPESQSKLESFIMTDENILLNEASIMTKSMSTLNAIEKKLENEICLSNLLPKFICARNKYFRIHFDFDTTDLSSRFVWLVQKIESIYCEADERSLYYIMRIEEGSGKLAYFLRMRSAKYTSIEFFPQFFIIGSKIIPYPGNMLDTPDNEVIEILDQTPEKLGEYSCCNRKRVLSGHLWKINYTNLFVITSRCSFSLLNYITLDLVYDGTDSFKGSTSDVKRVEGSNWIVFGRSDGCYFFNYITFTLLKRTTKVTSTLDITKEEDGKYRMVIGNRGELLLFDVKLSEGEVELEKKMTYQQNNYNMFRHLNLIKPDLLIYRVSGVIYWYDCTRNLKGRLGMLDQVSGFKVNPSKDKLHVLFVNGRFFIYDLVYIESLIQESIENELAKNGSLSNNSVMNN